MCCCSKPNQDMKKGVDSTTVEPTKQLANDPVCGMKVDPANAASVEFKGAKVYFCSKGCAAKFHTEPAKYLQQKQDANSIQELKKEEPGTDYTCPMHPEVHQAGLGNCPKCGMTRETASGAMPASRKEYTCPMHPEIVRDQPGNCPICGMALEPRDVTTDTANPELVNMARRFWIGVALTFPLARGHGLRYSARSSGATSAVGSLARLD